MDNLFYKNDLDDVNELKINLDDLYEQKRVSDLAKLNIYNKLLNRIHTRIKTTARQKNNNNVCWFVIPEVMIGAPKYDRDECIPYIVDKLKDNGFIVRYTHPNLLFISWSHWIPGYVREEIKKKTGMSVDGYGNEVNEKDKNKDNKKIGGLLTNKNDTIKLNKNDKDKDFTSVDDYKPTGNLIYNKDLLKKIEDKL
tara:strand:+ start:55 stop:642 length:588 start_codon:yes stop_codon:yes gene_type:complete